MCVCVLLMNEGRWSSDSDLQSEVGSTRVPDPNQNQHQIRMLEEEEEVRGGHARLHHDLHHNLTNNTGAGEEEEDEEEDGGSKMEDEDEEMDSTSGACSPELMRDSSSLSCSPSVCEGPLSPEEIPVGVFSPRDLSRCVSETLRVLEERGDDAALPQRLHQIAECLVQEEDYERAVRFLQLERLYHERVLSNITALQETWVSRWRCRRSVENSLPHCNLNSEHLDKLKHICMTHRQPTWSSDTCELVHRISVNGESCGEKNITSESPCNDKSGMLEQDDVSPSESGTAYLAQQREPTHVCDSASSPPTSSPQAPPTLVMTESSSPATIREEAEKQCDREQESEGEKEQETERIPQEIGKEAEPGGGRMEVELERDGMEVEPVESDQKREEGMTEGGVEPVSHAEQDKEAKKQEEEQEEEVEEALELEEELQRPEDTILDDLAKRIQVEEITPASGLISILKRRVRDGGDDTSSTNRQTKRRVRFHVPDDGLEHDEVGGDSWLLLLLLCLVTVVISVGGTALYCAFGDAHSSVCTDFSHNIDFYMGKVQRSVDDITHFFSSSSS
ncbi:consortin [Ictalurus furcatus]|uniref:consortin n=1 Tax=Ictalurus furcatus TaxID=66913 RepID=UPI00235004EA|nr:consortin [Ictalurus furcatus]